MSELDFVSKKRQQLDKGLPAFSSQEVKLKSLGFPDKQSIFICYDIVMYMSHHGNLPLTWLQQG